MESRPRSGPGAALGEDGQLPPHGAQCVAPEGLRQFPAARQIPPKSLPVPVYQA